MTRDTFGVILRYFEDMPNLQVDFHHGGREPLTVEKQLLMTLWYLGSQDTIHRVADRFGVSESTVLKMRNKIVDATLEHLMPKLIKWPDQNEQNDISNFFERKNGFPGIIGCLDGTHIQICAPKESAVSYVNRKGFHSLQLQAVCRENMTFTHCFVGYPGSWHDARVLRNSDLWETGSTKCGQGHIVADGAYPIQRWLLTPYRDNGHLTLDEKRYNRLLSANRVTIERSFGLLKGRFKRLQYLVTAEVETALKIILACCVFHNICILNCDSIEEFMEVDNNRLPNPILFVQRNANQNEGIVKRVVITRNLPR